jgi:integrase
MATIRFRLRYANEDKIQSVYMWVCVGDSHRLKIKVPNIQIHNNQWDKVKGRVRNIKEIHNRHEINGLLDSMEFAAKKAITAIEKHNPPATFEKITAAIREIYPTTKNKKQIPPTEPKQEEKTAEKMTFWAFLESHINDMKTTIGRNGNLPENQTIKNYKNSFNCLKEFEAKYSKSIAFENIDIDFITEYKNYLTIEKQHKPNTISSKVHKLCLLLETAYDKGLHNNTSYRRKEFKVKREQVQNVYLNEHELKLIYSYDFSANKRLESVVDWFLIACWTGLAHADCEQLSKTYINGKDTVIVERKKTKEKAIVNLTIEVIPNILAKNNGNFPHLITNQKFNDYIKEALKMVGINEPVTIRETIGGKRVNTTKEKWEFVSHHTGRRSFATNMLRRDVPISIIMAHTGHSTEKEFQKYVKSTLIERQGDLKQYMK